MRHKVAHRETTTMAMRMRPFGAVGVVLLLAATSLAATVKSPLADATEAMDRASIRGLLKRRVDVNAPQVDGMTALHWAAYQDDIEVSKLLLDAGANVKAENRYGVTPLSLACQNGNTALVKLLLEAGANPNATLRGGETALMTAARSGRTGPVKALLARDAKVDWKEP